MEGVMAFDLRVLQRVATWLPRTETWIASQIHHLPGDIESLVSCYEASNLSEFPADIAYCLAKHRVSRLLRKTGKHIGYRWGYQGEMRAARSRSIRLVHSHFGHVGWDSLPIVDRLGCAHVVTFYGLDVNYIPRVNPAWRSRYLELFEEASLVLCEGPHMASCVIALGANPETVKVHRLGVDLSRLPFAPRTWNPGLPLKVLVAASFREKKGIPYAIEALKTVAETRPVELTIVGDAGPDERSRAEKARIEHQLSTIPAGLKVTRKGFVSHGELVGLARHHHLFLSPSVTAADGDTEGGAPVALIEMAATGMPIVSTRHCDIPGTVIDGRTTLLASERSVSSLVESIAWWTQAPQQWPERLLEQRAHIERDFDAERQGALLASHYREVTAQTAGRRG